MHLRPTRILLATLGLSAVSAVQGATIVWDGSEADGFWTNGPQNAVSPGGTFPANGTTGANWTIDAGSAGQIVTPSTGPGGNLIDYGFDGHDWTINNATISEDVQVKLDGGSLAVTGSTISLVPSSANTSANLSGFNLGQSGNTTTATFTNSSLTAGRSNQNGYALRLLNSDTDLVNTTVNVNAETGSGDMDVRNASTLSITGGSAVNVQRDLDLRNTAAVDVDATSALTVGEGIEVLGADASLTISGGTVNAGWVRGNSGNNSPQSLQVIFDGGSVVLNDPNPLRDNSAFEGQFNWTGAAGSGTVTHTDLSANDTNLAGKLTQGFFSIDGTAINPTLPNTTDWSVQANIDTLNAELLTLAVNGKHFELTSDGSQQVLSLVPEPGSLALLGLGGLLVARRRR